MSSRRSRQIRRTPRPQHGDRAPREARHLLVISVLASSISSRTSTVTRSETSVTAVAKFSWVPFYRARRLRIMASRNPPANAAPTTTSGRSCASWAKSKPPDEAVDASTKALRRGGGRGLGLIGHSGGSSSKTRIQIMPGDARRDEACDRADACQHSRPDQSLDQGTLRHRRRIQSDSGRTLPGRCPAATYPSRPRQIVSTISAFARSSSSSPTESESKIQPVRTCSIRP